MSNHNISVNLTKIMVMYFLITAITCQTGLVPPSGGTITYTSTSSSAPWPYLTTATYRCFDERGFGLSGGNRVRTCVGSSSGPGEWDGTAPICEGEYTLYITKF